MEESSKYRRRLGKDQDQEPRREQITVLSITPSQEATPYSSRENRDLPPLEA